MLPVDYVIIGIIAVSAIIGLARGLVREVISLGVWVAALAAAWFFHPQVTLYLEPWISTPTIRIAAAVLLIIFGVLVAGAVVAWALTTLIDKTGLTGTDRLLGMVFGAARGAILVALLVFLASLTPVTQDPMWTDAKLLGQFNDLALWLLDQVPPEVRAKVQTL